MNWNLYNQSAGLCAARAKQAEHERKKARDPVIAGDDPCFVESATDMTNRLADEAQSCLGGMGRSDEIYR